MDACHHSGQKTFLFAMVHSTHAHLVDVTKRHGFPEKETFLVNTKQFGRRCTNVINVTNTSYMMQWGYKATSPVSTAKQPPHNKT